MVDLICLGEPMVEFDQSADGHYVQGFGGDTSNCAISAARQGANVGYLTRLGADQFGDNLITLWQNEKIDTSNVTRDPDHLTGIYFVTHDKSGHHFTYYRKHSAASNMRASDLSEHYISGAKYLHVSAISQAISEHATQTVNDAIDIANRNNTAISFDTNLRLALWSEGKARRVIHDAMRNCQIALPSYDDATILTGHSNGDAIVDFYLNLGPKVVVLKMGQQGCIVATPELRVKCQGIQVKSVDANAAGDTFAGAFLAELIRGETPFAAAQYANLAAALSTTFPGAVAAIPHRTYVQQEINQRNGNVEQTN